MCAMEPIGHLRKTCKHVISLMLRFCVIFEDVLLRSKPVYLYKILQDLDVDHIMHVLVLQSTILKVFSFATDFLDTLCPLVCGALHHACRFPHLFCVVNRER